MALRLILTLRVCACPFWPPLQQVSDFGLSRIADRTTRDSKHWGTVYFMAPETFDGVLAPQSDVYSFGITLWQVCGGQREQERRSLRGSEKQPRIALPRHAAGTPAQPLAASALSRLLAWLRGWRGVAGPGLAWAPLLRRRSVPSTTVEPEPLRSGSRRHRSRVLRAIPCRACPQMLTGEQPWPDLHPGQIIVGVQAGELQLDWPAHAHPRLVRLGQACLQHERKGRPSFHQVLKVRRPARLPAPAPLRPPAVTWDALRS